jgi:hypothetical protein
MISLMRKLSRFIFIFLPFRSLSYIMMMWESTLASLHQLSQSRWLARRTKTPCTSASLVQHQLSGYASTRTAQYRWDEAPLWPRTGHLQESSRLHTHASLGRGNLVSILILLKLHLPLSQFRLYETSVVISLRQLVCNVDRTTVK